MRILHEEPNTMSVESPLTSTANINEASEEPRNQCVIKKFNFISNKFVDEQLYRRKELTEKKQRGKEVKRNTRGSVRKGKCCCPRCRVGKLLKNRKLNTKFLTKTFRTNNLQKKNWEKKNFRKSSRPAF
eukprot:TRINITY_DN1155_c0_g2_i17.p1 TRINITY_DN1155_c0_g2~~TRINITY_DN1155_c0_g2_i17.p1  ORF type:complete len:129 (-),score=18.16 TRINITY_DN1155_c0_g2_i17:233-619(-)